LKRESHVEIPIAEERYKIANATPVQAEEGM